MQGESPVHPVRRFGTVDPAKVTQLTAAQNYMVAHLLERTLSEKSLMDVGDSLTGMTQSRFHAGHHSASLQDRATGTYNAMLRINGNNMAEVLALYSSRYIEVNNRDTALPPPAVNSQGFIPIQFAESVMTRIDHSVYSAAWGACNLFRREEMALQGNHVQPEHLPALRSNLATLQEARVLLASAEPLECSTPTDVSEARRRYSSGATRNATDVIRSSSVASTGLRLVAESSRTH